MNENPEIKKIEMILNETILPHIKRDGGDISIISFSDNVLRINYKGACLGCPMAKTGTLKAIETILKEKYNSNISVEADG